MWDLQLSRHPVGGECVEVDASSRASERDRQVLGGRNGDRCAEVTCGLVYQDHQGKSRFDLEGGQVRSSCCTEEQPLTSTKGRRELARVRVVGPVREGDRERP